MSRVLIALLLPFVAFFLERIFWAYIQPHVWFLFFPAIFASSWIGGPRVGVIATALASVLVIWFFLPPQGSFVVDSRHFVAIGIFLCTGVAFAVFHDRLTKAVTALGAQKQLDADLRAMTDLHEVGSLFLSESRHLEPVLSKIVDAAIAVSNADCGNIQLLDPRSSDLRIVAHRGFSKEWLDFWSAVASGRGTCGTALERGRRVIVEDVEADPIFVGNPALQIQRTAGVRAVVSTPLFTRSGVPLGMFSTHYKKPHRPDGRELRLLDLLARQSADIIELWDTNQKRIEALAESERANERLKGLINDHRVFTALVENSSDFIGIADASGKPVYLNPAGRRMVGLSLDHPVQDTAISDYYPPNQRSFASEVIVRSMVENGHWEGETYFRHWQTGKAIPVSDKHFAIYDPDTAQVLGMATVTRDISELREVQDQLRRTNDELAEAREFLENVFASSTEYSIIAKDLDRRVLAWNKGAERIYGYDASEVIGRSSDMLHAPEEVRSGIVKDLHQRALVEGRATGLFHRRRKDGSTFVARVMITRRSDATGRPIGYLLVSHDVTAEQRLVDEQRFLAKVGESLQSSLDYAETVECLAHLVVEFIGDGCAVDIAEGQGDLARVRVVHADPAKEGLAQALEKILPDRNHPVWRVMQTKKPLSFRDVTPDLLRFVAKNDEHLRLLESVGVRSAMLVPLVARDRLLAVLTIVSCRTDRRYGAGDLRLAEELARRASFALENAHLYEVAQRAIETRDQVLGVVAHDLRNPLGSILMQATLLQRRGAEPDPRSRQTLHSIERSVARMDRLIQDLLDVTRLEGAGLGLEPARVSSVGVVSDSVEGQRALAQSASLDLRLDVRDGLPEIWADRDRLQQVFENLIGNAVKFTEPGGRVGVGATVRGREVLFWVSDTGSGIAPDDVPHLFDRFWRANGTDRRGAGLGLPIVRGIVEAHGGRIWVESEPGHGSTFFFTIPLADPGQPETAPRAH